MSVQTLSKEKNKPWFVYVVQCKDGSLYTGTTTDVSRRIAEHNSGKGAKYTATRKPVALKYFEEMDSQSNALKREISLKKLSRKEKLQLFENI